jgi:hypothetical protein
MQKVVGSNPISRLQEKPPLVGGFVPEPVTLRPAQRFRERGDAFAARLAMMGSAVKVPRRFSLNSSDRAAKGPG